MFTLPTHGTAFLGDSASSIPAKERGQIFSAVKLHNQALVTSGDYERVRIVNGIRKGIFILGPERGLALARAEGVEALLIDPTGRFYSTEGFREVFQFEQKER